MQEQSMTYLTKAFVQTLGQRAVRNFRLEIGRKAGIAVALESSQDVTTAAVHEERRGITFPSLQQRTHFICTFNSKKIRRRAIRLDVNHVNTYSHAHHFKIIVSCASRSGHLLVTSRNWVFTGQNAILGDGIITERAAKVPEEKIVSLVIDTIK